VSGSQARKYSRNPKTAVDGKGLGSGIEEGVEKLRLFRDVMPG
jgi:hypothetical protein